MRKILTLVAVLMTTCLYAGNYVAEADVLKVNNRPAESERLFRSDAVEKQIKEIARLLTNRTLHRER